VLQQVADFITAVLSEYCNDKLCNLLHHVGVLFNLMDQIFALRSILEKCFEYNITLHELFIDFKQAYDSINREKLILILEEFKIPRKLINLIGMTLRNTTVRVKV